MQEKAGFLLDDKDLAGEKPGFSWRVSFGWARTCPVRRPSAFICSSAVSETVRTRKDFSMNKQREVYKEEANELLADIEVSLLELEETPDDPELIGRVFRALHTIKGSGAMAGFDDIADFAHEIETIFDRVRDGNLPVTKDLVSLALSARDQIKMMLDASGTGERIDTFRLKGLVAAFRELLPESSEAPEADGMAEPSEPAGKDETEGNDTTYRIRFRPKMDIFKDGTNPILLLNELRELGPCNVLAQTDDIPFLENFDPEACYTYWDIILTTSKGTNAIRDVFIFVEQNCQLNIEMIDAAGLESDYKRLGEILLERNDLCCDDLGRVLVDHKRLGEKLVEKNLVDMGIVQSALVEQAHVKQIRKKRHETAIASSVRVPAEKLDSLVDLVGELVTLQARFTQEVTIQGEEYAETEDHSELVSISEELDRLTADLRDITMSIRMLPIGTTFSSFRRLVRDLSDELGKDIRLITEGGETELDKTVIERLNDPLVHIIRNSVDHGIEAPKIRETSGKSRQGTIRLWAEHYGADVLIRISDDGAGLDPDVIRVKAEERGVVSLDDELSESQIFSQIFSPSLSTSEQVTDISGRGVGMDVVKRSIESLRGAIEIESDKGTGTTITLKIPLTLAIIDGFLVKIGEGYFVLPLSSVEECVSLSPEDMELAKKRNMMRFRDQIIQYLDLRDIFNTEEVTSNTERVVIVEARNERVGLGVGQVIGQHQTVIKTLSRVYRDVEGISGATILGDGTVALILDVSQLADSMESN